MLKATASAQLVVSETVPLAFRMRNSVTVALFLKPPVAVAAVLETLADSTLKESKNGVFGGMDGPLGFAGTPEVSAGLTPLGRVTVGKGMETEDNRLSTIPSTQ